MRFYRKALAMTALGGLNSLLLLLVPTVGEGQDGMAQVTVLSTASCDGETSPCG